MHTTITHEQISNETLEFAALYVLGCLEEPERLDFETHLQDGCRICREERPFSRLILLKLVTHSGLSFSMNMKKGAVLLALLTTVALASVTNSHAAARNHLEGQTSPYLKRAVKQPIDWYPWGPEAFKRAQELNRPILLDVGAVWCSWCGLMDRNTYTIPETADYVNQHFIAIKVDFDTSSGLVAHLQRAQAVLNLPAGLPLTSFITPGGKLYLGAGYLASEANGDKLSFKETAELALRSYASKQASDEDSFQLEVPK